MTVVIDLTAPTGYGVAFDPTVLDAGNVGAASFTFTGAEVGARYFWEVDDGNGATPKATGNGLVTSSSQTVTGLNLANQGEGTLTLSFYLKDVALNRDLTAATLLNYTPKRQGLYEDGSPCTPADSEDEYLMQQSEYDQAFLKAYGIKYQGQLLNPPFKHPSYYPVWSFVIEDASPSAVAKAKMENLGMTYYPQLILCDPSEYDAKWEEFLAAWAAAGVEPYLDDVNQQIQKKLGK
jgi:hypothetical protein